MTKNREKLDSTINGLEEYERFWEKDEKDREQGGSLLIVELDFFCLVLFLVKGGKLGIEVWKFYWEIYCGLKNIKFIVGLNI